MPRYCAANCPGDASRRYVPGGRPRNSNMPCRSVVVMRPRKDAMGGWGDPPTIGVASIVTMPPVVLLRGGAAIAGGIGDNETVAWRTGLPVSAAMTRPRIAAVPAV